MVDEDFCTIYDETAAGRMVKPELFDELNCANRYNSLLNLLKIYVVIIWMMHMVEQV